MARDQIFSKARTKHVAGKYGEAIKLYQMVLMKRPSDLDANYLLGTAYAETGKLEEARKYLLKAEQLEPGSPYIKVNLGIVHKWQGDYESALVCFVNALLLKNDLQEARHNLGVVSAMMDQPSEKAAQGCLEYALSCIQAGRNDEAIEILTIGNSLDCNNTYIRYLLTILEGKTPDKELQDAFDLLEAETCLDL